MVITLMKGLNQEWRIKRKEEIEEINHFPNKRRAIRTNNSIGTDSFFTISGV